MEGFHLNSSSLEALLEALLCSVCGRRLPDAHRGGKPSVYMQCLTWATRGQQPSRSRGKTDPEVEGRQAQCGVLTPKGTVVVVLTPLPLLSTNCDFRLGIRCSCRAQAGEAGSAGLLEQPELICSTPQPGLRISRGPCSGE